MRKESSSEMNQILKETKVIAVVGHSDKPYRTSYAIAQYLRQAGFKVYPVNPTVKEIDGEKSYPTVSSIPERVDLVNVFRRSEKLDPVVEDAIKAGAKAIWTQIGVYGVSAGEKAWEAGLKVVMNRCIKIEHQQMLSY